MLIPAEFDEANSERRSRINRNAIRTAKKLNDRISVFFNDIDRNPSLTQAQKRHIKSETLKELI